jgi:hypothetical protein
MMAAVSQSIVRKEPGCESPEISLKRKTFNFNSIVQLGQFIIRFKSTPG